MRSFRVPSFRDENPTFQKILDEKQKEKANRPRKRRPRPSRQQRRDAHRAGSGPQARGTAAPRPWLRDLGDREF